LIAGHNYNISYDACSVSLSVRAATMLTFSDSPTVSWRVV